jgi:hypothetical protein
MNGARLSRSRKGQGVDSRTRGTNRAERMQHDRVHSNHNETLPPDLRGWIDCIVPILVKQYLAHVESQHSLPVNPGCGKVRSKSTPSRGDL